MDTCGSDVQAGRPVALGAVATLAALSLTGALLTHAGTEASAAAVVDDGTPPSAAEPWPGGSATVTASVAGQFGTDLSGLSYEPAADGSAATLWAVRNDPPTLYKLQRQGDTWVPVTTDHWSVGKSIYNPGSSSSPDSEAVTMTAAGSAGGVYVASERSNPAKNTSRLSVLRYEVGNGAALDLTATREWNLTADLPAVDPNQGFESIAWVPDTDLTAAGFVDQSTGQPYAPDAYPGHGDGLFFVGLEQGGTIYGYALDHSTGGYSRIATIEPSAAARSLGASTLMELQWDGDHQQLWATCDDGCSGRSATYRIATSGSRRGAFTLTHVYQRPSGLINANNEGFAFAPDAECVGDGVGGGSKPAWWADDDQSGGYSIRQGTLSCVPPVEPTEPAETDPPASTPTDSPSATPDATTSPSATPTPQILVGKRTTRSRIVVKALAGRRIRVGVSVAGLARTTLDQRIAVKVAGVRGIYGVRLRDGVGTLRLHDARAKQARAATRVRLIVTVKAFDRTSATVSYHVRKTVKKVTLTYGA